jgi:hypothetical protein
MKPIKCYFDKHIFKIGASYLQPCDSNYVTIVCKHKDCRRLIITDRTSVSVLRECKQFED